MRDSHSISLPPLVTQFSQDWMQHFERYVQCAPGNRDPPHQAVPEALVESPACDTILSYNLPRTTRVGGSVCSSFPRTPGCKRVRRGTPGSRKAQVSSPSALRSSAPEERFFAAVV